MADTSLALVKSENFGTVPCNFYRQGEEIVMTREQVGTALGLAEPAIAISKIHNRHKDRIDRFSGLTKLVTPSGTQETVVYSYDGIFEICRFSRSKVADSFMDFCREITKSVFTTGQYVPQTIPTPPALDYKAKRLEILNMNAVTRQAKMLKSMIPDNAPAAYRQVVYSKISHMITGEHLIPLPAMTGRVYSASEIGLLLGISATMVGRLANRYHLKAPTGQHNEHGEWIWDKAKHADKQVQSWVYSEAGLSRLRELMQSGTPEAAVMHAEPPANLLSTYNVASVLGTTWENVNETAERLRLKSPDHAVANCYGQWHRCPLANGTGVWSWYFSERGVNTVRINLRGGEQLTI
jgi:prophage antirepressor-like protein